MSRRYDIVDKDLQTSEEGLGLDDRLDSWKEISVYLRRTVRTVQRWEQTEELPIHRIVHEKRSTVFAYKHELDKWWRSRQATKSGRLVPPEIVAGTEAEPALLTWAQRTDFYWIILTVVAVVAGAVLYTRL